MAEALHDVRVVEDGVETPDPEDHATEAIDRRTTQSDGEIRTPSLPAALDARARRGVGSAVGDDVEGALDRTQTRNTTPFPRARRAHPDGAWRASAKRLAGRVEASVTTIR